MKVQKEVQNVQFGTFTVYTFHYSAFQQSDARMILKYNTTQYILQLADVSIKWAVLNRRAVSRLVLGIWRAVCQ